VLGTIMAATTGIVGASVIMLVIMGDLMTVPVGTLFTAAILPGLLMSSLYIVQTFMLCPMRPGLALALGAHEGPQITIERVRLAAWRFVPPSVTMMHIDRGIIPFVLVQLLALALCMIFPEVVLYLPRRWGFFD